MKERITAIEKRLLAACERSGRSRDDITLVAVTKSISDERTAEFIEAGMIHVGENRTERMVEKHAAIHQPQIKWHFIGNLQSRKVKDIIDIVDVIHSVDRLSVAKQIDKRAVKPIDCFVQVNVSGESSKSGLAPDEVQGFIESLRDYDKVRIIGLMTMAPYDAKEEELRQYFRQMRVLRDQIALQQLQHAPCTELSMGMSNDFEIAVEEGATYVRIGTALVGSEKEA